MAIQKLTILYATFNAVTRYSLGALIFRHNYMLYKYLASKHFVICYEYKTRDHLQFRDSAYQSFNLEVIMNILLAIHTSLNAKQSNSRISL